MQRFYEVYFDTTPLFEAGSTKVAAEVDELLHRYALPFYAQLNGARGTSQGFLRKNKFVFGAYRGLVIRLSEIEDSDEIGRIVDYGERGPFTGKFLYSHAKVDPEKLLKLGNSPQKIGNAVTSIYEDGLNKVRGRFGIPKFFLEEFVRDYVDQEYTSEFEHALVSLSEHKLFARLISESAPLEERHYLAIRRFRKSTEDKVHVGTIDKAHATRMHHNPTFDGTTFHIEPWLKKPAWPVSFCRVTVELGEFQLGDS